MNHLESFPWWIALPAAAFLVLGATLTLIGAVGLFRLRSFYDRIHAPTLGTSWGAAGLLIASILLFSWGGSRVVIHEFVIGAFLLITTPVTLMMLGRAALYRDRLAGSPDLPDHLHLRDAPPPAADSPGSAGTGTDAARDAASDPASAAPESPAKTPPQPAAPGGGTAR